LSTQAIRYASAALSDRGRKRPNNEDAFGLSADDGVYLVCDGLGGAAAGEIASALAVDEVLRRFSSRAGFAPLEDLVNEAVCAANLAILSRAQRTPRLKGMGTTLVGLAVESRRVLVFNVGDSRCYRLRNHSPGQSGLRQISLDHSLVSEMVQKGEMTRAEAMHSNYRNVITRALGSDDSVTPDRFELEAEPGDLFLLCSDGLTSEVDDSKIETILAADLPLDILCARLVEAAIKVGGRDNITCLLLRAES
jgi:protein phosphatase